MPADPVAAAERIAEAAVQEAAHAADRELYRNAGAMAPALEVPQETSDGATTPAVGPPGAPQSAS